MQNNIFKRLVLTALFCVVFGLNIQNVKAEETTFFITLIWYVTPGEAKLVDEYTSLMKIVKANKTIKLCLSISPQVYNSWKTGAPELWKSIRALHTENRVSVVFNTMNEVVMPVFVNYDLLYGNTTDDAVLPRMEFSYQQDVMDQIVRGWQVYSAEFNAYPDGIVPAYGAVSPQVVELLGSVGAKWTAAPVSVLGQMGYFPVVNYKFQERKIAVFIRENELSKMIELPDILMNPSEIVKTFWKRVEEYKRQGDIPGVTVIVTGEKFWAIQKDYFTEFLGTLFSSFNQYQQVVMMLPSEVMARGYFLPAINAFTPATWLDQGWNAWFGTRWQHTGWVALAQVRKMVDTYKNSGRAEITALDRATEEIYRAEDGSVFIALGQEFDQERVKVADMKLRQGLTNVYRAMGNKIPAELKQPLGETLQNTVTQQQQQPGIVQDTAPVVSPEIMDTVVNKGSGYFDLMDSIGDDYGDGNYVYPAITVLEKGVYDLQKFSCRYDEQSIEFRINTSGGLTQEQRSYVGIHCYIDMNNRQGAGLIPLLSGLNAYARPDNAWEFCVNIHGKAAKVFQSGVSNYKMLGVYDVNVSTSETGCEYHVLIPKKVLRGTPERWRYLVLSTAVSPDGAFMKISQQASATTAGGASVGTTIAPVVFDVIPPVGKSQKLMIEQYKTGRFAEFPFVEIK
ncbi:MAG: glucodextranase DOMON-like domain-containing protein [Elusimicrobiota bacterium]